MPQLAAPGISAHEVRKLSGFKVIYGPIRASDIPEFIDSNMRAKPGMREKTFTLGERLSLVPVELVHALKTFLLVLPVILLLSGLASGTAFLDGALRFGSSNAAGLLIGIIAGCVITPALLPWLPGRAFTAKGILPGLAGFLLFVIMRNAMSMPIAGWLEKTAWIFILPAVSAYLAMNFTGCSTFTSLSGVKKEMRWAVPAEIAALCLGIVLWIVALFL